mmetsp:Transcript_26682/g.61450  ORF Transcript_26682/g.61450 Transcript_26682/m.61450 type:complete len:217 (+) Transcript_26682:96-746(+)
MCREGLVRKRHCWEDCESDASTVSGGRSPVADDDLVGDDDGRRVRARGSKKVGFQYFSERVTFAVDNIMEPSPKLVQEPVETKVTDGPEPATLMFETVLLQFVERRTVCDHEDILCLFAGHGLGAFEQLARKCHEIVETLEKNGRVSILPSTVHLDRRLLPHLLRLRTFCDNACETARQRELAVPSELEHALVNAALNSVCALEGALEDPEATLCF